jgi:hypothetical protein
VFLATLKRLPLADFYCNLSTKQPPLHTLLIAALLIFTPGKSFCPSWQNGAQCTSLGNLFRCSSRYGVNRSLDGGSVYRYDSIESVVLRRGAEVRTSCTKWEGLPNTKANPTDTRQFAPDIDEYIIAPCSLPLVNSWLAKFAKRRNQNRTEIEPAITQKVKVAVAA